MKFSRQKISHLKIECIRKVTDIISWILIPIVFIFAFVSRLFKKKYDIGIGPTPMINNKYFKKSLESQGYTAQTFVTVTYNVTDEFDCFMNNWLFIRAPFLRIFPILCKYKCLYFYFDGGILAPRKIYRKLEAYIYKAAGIKMVVMGYGADCFIPERTPNFYYKNAWFQDTRDFHKLHHDKRKRRVQYWCKHADVIIAYGDLIDYLYYWDHVRASVLSIDSERLKPEERFQFHRGGTIRIAHAPNHPRQKGSEYIEKAISDLKKEGYSVEYCYLSHKTNEEVLEMLQGADIVVDQLIVGWHGMFALEAMSLGKPVITHIRSDLLNAYEEMGCIEKGEMPLINATPTTIYDVLKNLVDHPETLAEIGRKSRAYVDKYHSIEKVGEYFDEINRSICIEPRDGDREKVS